jgi:ATP-dependent helicase/nuclease subunit A
MNIIFHASAGTGKTQQVTNLYAAYVLGRRFETKTADGKTVVLYEPGAAGPLDPRRILLMTFTENAAAELRTRVTQLILKARHEAEAGGNGNEVEKIVRVLRQLPAAPICTIHSFCAGFLRERALDAGLTPGFSVLDQDEADLILDESAEAELLARLNRALRPNHSDIPEYDPDLEAFCAGVRVLGGEYGTAVTHIVNNLLRQAAGKGVALDGAEDMLPPPRHSVSREDFVAALDAMIQERASRKDGLPDRAAKMFQTLEKNLRDFPTFETNDRIEQFAEALLADGRPSFSGAGLTEISNRLKERIGQVRTVARYRKHYAEVRAFARYAGAVARRYATRKQELGALDFDDLLIQSRAMLKKRPAGLKPFDVILLDEVQDTSRVQCEIIEELWDPASGRLVICGDRKQSIYAWRNADPKVMPDLEQIIQATARHRKVALRASYRSKDSILDFVNALFKEVYGESYDDDEVLVPAPEKNAALHRDGKEKPCVEFLLAPWEGKSSKFQVPSSKLDDKTTGEIPDLETRVKAEMEAVAQRIKLLVEGPDSWRTSYRYSDETERFEPVSPSNRYQYSDILILLRRSTNQQALERVLRIQGIPYRIGGRGKGLFTRPEVIDALLFLEVLTQPFDTISLIGFLRSPWVGLSDDSILQLGWKDSSFDEALFSKAVLSIDGEQRLSVEQAQRLGRARQFLTEFRSKIDYSLVSEILRELIQKTGYDTVICGMFRGTQRIANLKKLIDWIRRAERGGTILPADVVKMLKKYADNPPDIPEAALLDPEQNAVTILTIHGAKGLTARVVFVPELSSRLAGDSPWALLESRTGEAAGLYIKTEDIAHEEIRTPGFEQAREAARAIRAAESKNVFYVAMTRARDLVVLSGAGGDRKPAEWRAEIEKLVADHEDARQLLRRVPYADVEKATLTLMAGSEASATDSMELEPLLDAVTRLYTGTVPAPRILRFPATTLSSYHYDPVEFAKTKWASLDPFPRRPRRFPADGDDIPSLRDTDEVGSHADFGTAGHTVLEQLAASSWRGNVAALAEASGVENHLSARDISDLKTRLARAAVLMAKILAKSDNLRVEWPFAMLLEEGKTKLIVDGTMDLLFQNTDGAWHILDYKFTDEPESLLKKKYGLQLNLYRLALRRFQKDSEAAIHSSLIVVGRDDVKMVDIPENLSCLARTVQAAEALDTLFKAGMP